MEAAGNEISNTKSKNVIKAVILVAWPLVFIVMYAAGICLFLPGTLLTGLGAALFGSYLGTVVNWIGAMIGASAAFLIGRTLGREYAASLIGDKLQKYDDAIERNGFATVLYLRLVYFPCGFADR
jgi:uncharacterized membrane protein YdjX (TVP38/TMEM64 family)